MENNYSTDWGLVIDKATEAFNYLQKCIEYLVDVVIEGIKAILDNFDNILCFSAYPNKRAIHLALHHPKARVRKKNKKRIIKWILQER